MIYYNVLVITAQRVTVKSTPLPKHFDAAVVGPSSYDPSSCGPSSHGPSSHGLSSHGQVVMAQSIWAPRHVACRVCELPAGGTGMRCVAVLHIVLCAALHWRTESDGAIWCCMLRDVRLQDDGPSSFYPPNGAKHCATY